MCIAISALIISMEGTKARVECNGNFFEVETAIIEAKPGDYVLVHAGCAIEVIHKERAYEISEIFKELENIFNDIKPSQVII